MSRTVKDNHKRCIVSVANGIPYMRWQRDTEQSLAAAGEPAMRLFWNGAYPPGCPSHAVAPFAFKYYALKEAYRQGYEQVMWLDATVLAKANLQPIWDQIAGEGHMFVASGLWLGNWCSDRALSLFGLPREEAFGIPCVAGCVFGLNYAKPEGRQLLEGIREFTFQGAMQGPHIDERYGQMDWSDFPSISIGFVSADPRVYGHSHDEAVFAALLHMLGLPLASAFELVFAGPARRGCVRVCSTGRELLQLQGCRDRAQRIQASLLRAAA
jgi:hypothetical protein